MSLGKYRSETEAWLDTHGIEYNTLVMMDLPDKETRLERGNHAQYKANVYESTETTLFIESDPEQAKEICGRTNKPVSCYDTKEMFRPGLRNRTYRKTVGNLSAFKQNPVSFPLKVGKYLLNRSYYWISK